MLARALFETGHQFATPFNFGPLPDRQMTVAEVIECFTRVWGKGACWVHDADTHPVHEAGMLLLDSTRARTELGWWSQTGLDVALRHTVAWYRALQDGCSAGELERLTAAQIGAFSQGGNLTCSPA
jgi:CDP-glucose 4,6-dehydratase